ncbi:hypothetical protein QYF61_009460 [Mycteria americana]|uniref:Uncharacterized protein n=1 Tax=Mycteria americana TaxID=33587 RepID=A0AAN7N6Y4_MYCAM|nr:hypothetical protein QYF61_009460 [Mycteria americana]
MSCDEEIEDASNYLNTEEYKVFSLMKSGIILNNQPPEQILPRHSAPALLTVGARTEEIGFSCNMTFRKAAKRPVGRAATASGFLGEGGSERSQQHLPEDSCIAAAHGGQGGGFGVSTWAHMERVGSKKQGWGICNLFQCFTTLIVKNFFLISSLNLPSFSLKPLHLVLSQQALLKILRGWNKVSLQPSLLQAEQPQLSQPVLVAEVLQPSDHFCGPPLDPLQQLHVLLVLRAPELDTVLQDMVGFLGCECTLLAHVQLFIHQYPQVLLCRAALNPFIPQPVLMVGIAPTQVQDPALGLVEPHEVHTGPLLQVPLDGILSLRCVNRTTQLDVICKLAEGALNPTVYVIDEDIKQYWSQYRPLRDTTHHRSPSGH